MRPDDDSEPVLPLDDPGVRELLQRETWEVDGAALLEAGSLPENPPLPEPSAPRDPPSAPPQPMRPEEAPPPPLERILEAMLFLGGTPLQVEQACTVVRGLTESDFHHAVEHLNRTYRQQNRPYSIQRHEGGYQLTLRPRFAPLHEKLYGTVREARLSSPAIEVLALVAYRQPATRQEIDSLRGGESASLLRQLVRHGLIAVQRCDEGEKEVAYVTTQRFLELFHLKSLDELPQTQDLQRL